MKIYINSYLYGFFNKYLFFVFLSVFIISCSNKNVTFNQNYKELKSQLNSELNYIDTSYIDLMAKDFVIKGSNLQQQKRFAESILEFQDALKYDSSAAIYYAIAKSYKSMNKYDKAIEYCLQSLDKDSLFLPSIELMGETLILEFRITDAIKIYEQLCLISSDRNYKYTLARLYEVNAPKKAIKIYEELLENSYDEQLLERLITLYSQTDDNSKQLEAIERLYNLNPTNSDISYNYILVLLKNNKTSKVFDVIDFLDNQLTSSELTKIYSLSLSYLVTDKNSLDTEKVKSYLEKIDKKFRLNWRIMLQAIFLSNRIKDSVKTSRYIQQILNIADTVAEIPLEIGVMYLQDNDNITALKYFEGYENRFPDDYRYSLYSGIALSLLDSNLIAEDKITQAVRKSPNAPEPYVQLGLIYQKLNIIDSSDSAYQKALSLDPTNPTANNNYAYSLSERGIELEKALSMIRTAIKYDSTNVSFLDTYGWIQYKIGNMDTAYIYIKRSIDSGAKSSEVYEHLGEIFSKMNNYTEAKDAYKKALELNPNNSQIINKLKLLENK